MVPPLYVLGHKNPDSDSICAAIGYTELLHYQGHLEAVAARQGIIRRETAFILEHFRVTAPLLVTDVRPRVSDVMTQPAVVVHQDAPLHEVGQLLQQRGIRAVPIVDDHYRLCGITGVEDFARAFFTGLEADRLDQVPLNLENVVETLGGHMLAEAPDRVLRDRVMVGAMQIDSMLRRIEPDILLVIGDREDAQRAAIELGVGALVVTGGHAVSKEILTLARERNVAVIATPHHTSNTVRLIHLSAAIRHIMRTDVPTCAPDDLVEDVRERLRGGTIRSLAVVDDDGTVLGLISRSNLLREVRRRIVLVDHNEQDQAVTGSDEAEIVGVVDHHRVANFQTRTPPFMRLEPVGSTSTIVAKLFAEATIPVPPAIAGVLLGGILADTLLFRGPTTTPEDRRVAVELAQQADIDIKELGSTILKLASDISDRSPEQLISSDFKDFSVDEHHFGIGVIETTNGGDVLDRRPELLEVMHQMRQQGYTSVLFAVIDILNERTTLLAVGHAESVAAAFNVALQGGHTVELSGILSRKKNIIPLLGTISRGIGKG